jgi:hypothetical protein
MHTLWACMVFIIDADNRKHRIHLSSYIACTVIINTWMELRVTYIRIRYVITEVKPFVNVTMYLLSTRLTCYTLLTHVTFTRGVHGVLVNALKQIEYLSCIVQRC